MPTAPDQKLLRTRLAFSLRLAIGLGLLSLILLKIPWRDRVLLELPSGEARSILVAPATPDSRAAPHSKVNEAGRKPILLVGQASDQGWSFTLGPDDSAAASVGAPTEGQERAWTGATATYQPGLARSLRALSLSSFLLASVLALLGTCTASLRWKVLLAAADIHVPLQRAIRLNLAGLAASQVLLGSVGGDFVKGALVTRDAAVSRNVPARTSAVMALLMDRIIGLTALLAIGTFATLLVQSEADQLATWFASALILLLLGLVGTLFIADHFEFPSGTTPIWRILHSLHGALARYRKKPRALILGLALSFLSHSFLIAAIASLGTALGMRLETLRFFLLIPIVETAQAVPISPAGWGVAESLYVVLFRDAGQTASIALSLALSVRAITLTQALLGVPGLIALLRQRKSERGISEGP